MTEMFGEAWSPMSVPDLAPDDDDDDDIWSAHLTEQRRRLIIDFIGALERH